MILYYCDNCKEKIKSSKYNNKMTNVLGKDYCEKCYRKFQVLRDRFFNACKLHKFDNIKILTKRVK